MLKRKNDENIFFKEMVTVHYFAQIKRDA